MKIAVATDPLHQFRKNVYESFEYRRDALMELLDALTSNRKAPSVVELSLSPLFRRQYSSVFDAIENYLFADNPDELTLARRIKEVQTIRMIAPHLPRPEKRPFWLWAIDATSIKRQFSDTMEDRTYVHQPNAVAGNKPVTIGHQYSTVACLPEKEFGEPAWVVPMIIRRITSGETETELGVEVLATLLEDNQLPWAEGSDLVVNTADSKYGIAGFLGRLATYHNLINVTRLRGNRVLYRQPEEVPEGKRSRGRPKWYGKRFDLKDSSTWDEPDQSAQSTLSTLSGKEYQVVIEGWNDVLMRGKRDIPMHKHPFTLVRVRVLKEDGQKVFKRPLWLVVCGQRRAELSLVQIWEAYRQRYDLEHFFRFGKQRLLMGVFQTRDLERSENWMHLVQLAYVQLFMIRDLAINHPRPWERYLPEKNGTVATPSQAQRDFERIIGEIGTPARAPKVRGKSAGRQKGTTLKQNKRQPVVKKSKKATKAKKASAKAA